MFVLLFLFRMVAFQPFISHRDRRIFMQLAIVSLGTGVKCF